ncbi:MAG TPA: O-antigen ligase family protein [Acidimicrobiales bacterium]|nr:O-antigen ligase family protein [Acidimicrobiales bacterium]
MKAQERHGFFPVAAGLGLTTASVVLGGGFDLDQLVWLPLTLSVVVAISRPQLERRDAWLVAALACFAGVWLGRGALAGTAGRAASLSAFAIAFGCTYVLARSCDESDRDAATRWLTWLSAGVAVISLVGFLRHAEPWALAFDGAWRLAGPFAYPNAAGLFFALGLMAALRPDRRGWPERAGLGIGTATALLATMSRAALLLAALALAGRARRTTSLVVGGVVIGVVAFALIANNASVDDRVAEWSAALRQFRSEPIFGVGPERDLLIHNFRGDAIARYAHNEVLQIGAGAGAIGLASLAFVVVFALRVRRGQLVLAMLAVGALVDFNLHFLGVATMAGWLVGLDEPAPTDRPRRSRLQVGMSRSSRSADSEPT